MCALFNDTELLCQDFEAYAQLCQEEGVDLGLWRQKTGCSEYPGPHRGFGVDTTGSSCAASHGLPWPAPHLPKHAGLQHPCS